MQSLFTILYRLFKTKDSKVSSTVRIPELNVNIDKRIADKTTLDAG